MSDWKKLAEVLFSDVDTTIADLEQQYPERNEEFVSRFAPSPTGFLHIGAVYASFIPSQIAQQTWGKFILRLEDTDQKRSIENGVETIVDGIKSFGVPISEGPIGDEYSDVGDYGPYIQSKRKHLYHIFIKELVASGKAYPCWMSNDEIDSIRDQQRKTKTVPWIYWNYSLWRNKSAEELVAQAQENPNYVIRFRAHGDTQKKIIFEDVIRGKVNMMDNHNDIVLLKSNDKLPTYHLAHIVDDYLMRVTHVIRAEERLTSVPLHLQLWEAFGITAPKYAHLAQILKLDDETSKKRKLSKRKDPEADVAYFFENGYGKDWIIEYLLGLIDSWFEERRKENLETSYFDYKISLEKMNKSWALFDLVKLQSVNNNYLSRISNEELFQESLDRAKKYRPSFAKYMQSEADYTLAALSIERHTEKDPKRFSTYQDVEAQLLFFYDTEREKSIKEIKNKIASWEESFLSEEISSEVLSKFVDEYMSVLDLSMSVEDRFTQLKEVGAKYKFAANNKMFKEWWYIGKIWELAMFFRVALCASKRTPDLFSVMKVMGKEKIQKRLREFLK